MRGIRGWIRNLVDGQGPPVGTVDVSARPEATEPAELNLTTHRLGNLFQWHLGGSGSTTKADSRGHFGWDMELSPGKINVDITPHDPAPTQYRKRFPDESAQIGKAFITDLERLGWAGGKDHLIWDAVFGGNQPTAATWNSDPNNSSTMGNWSVDFGTTAGRVTIRKGIAMLGGVPFTVEMNDLMVPITGEAAMDSNVGSQDRWDLICLQIDWNPDSPDYGKQSFLFQMGAPGAGIPPFPGNAGNFRRLPLHAVLMPPGSDHYTKAYDLRRWDSLPSNVTQAKIYSYIPPSTPPATGWETIANWINAGINTNLGTDPFTLPLGSAWEGHGTATFQVDFFEDQTHTPGPFVVWIWTEYQDMAGEWKLGDYVVKPPATPGAPPVTPGGSAATNFAWQQWWQLGGVPPAGMALYAYVTIPFTCSRIPAYHVDSGVMAGAGRSWNKLRFRIMYGSLNGYLYVRQQDLVAQFFPVT